MALHPGPAPWVSKTSPPPTEHGGEREEASEAAVTTSYTEVCGKDFSGKSCSKICLVTVYPAGNRNKGQRMYAMLDDQSNRSLACSEFFDMFRVNSPTLLYTLKTCSSVSKVTGHQAVAVAVARWIYHRICRWCYQSFSSYALGVQHDSK